MMYCFSRWSFLTGPIFRMLANQGSSRHFQISGDMMLASTSAYSNSGKIKISMSESVKAEEYFSRSFLFMINKPQRRKDAMQLRLRVFAGFLRSNLFDYDLVCLHSVCILKGQHVHARFHPGQVKAVISVYRLRVFSDHLLPEQVRKADVHNEGFGRDNVECTSHRIGVDIETVFRMFADPDKARVHFYQILGGEASAAAGIHSLDFYCGRTFIGRIPRGSSGHGVPADGSRFSGRKFPNIAAGIKSAGC